MHFAIVKAVGAILYGELFRCRQAHHGGFGSPSGLPPGRRPAGSQSGGFGGSGGLRWRAALDLRDLLILYRRPPVGGLPSSRRAQRR